MKRTASYRWHVTRPCHYHYHAIPLLLPCHAITIIMPCHDMPLIKPTIFKRGMCTAVKGKFFLEVNFPYEWQWGCLFGLMTYTVWSSREDAHMRCDNNIISTYHPYLSICFCISVSPQSSLRFGHQFEIHSSSLSCLIKALAFACDYQHWWISWAAESCQQLPVVLGRWKPWHSFQVASTYIIAAVVQLSHSETQRFPCYRIVCEFSGACNVILQVVIPSTAPPHIGNNLLLHTRYQILSPSPPIQYQSAFMQIPLIMLLSTYQLNREACENYISTSYTLQEFTCTVLTLHINLFVRYDRKKSHTT